MNLPSIVFSEEDKSRFQQMAVALEAAFAREGKSTSELKNFASYAPFVKVIALVKDRQISTPIEIPNMNYWYFESPLAEWFHFSESEARFLLSDFLRLVSGLPLTSKGDDEVND